MDFRAKTLQQKGSIQVYISIDISRWFSLETFHLKYPNFSKKNAKKIPITKRHRRQRPPSRFHPLGHVHPARVACALRSGRFSEFAHVKLPEMGRWAYQMRADWRWCLNGVGFCWFHSPGSWNQIELTPVLSNFVKWRLSNLPYEIPPVCEPPRDKHVQYFLPEKSLGAQNHIRLY